MGWGGGGGGGSVHGCISQCGDCWMCVRDLAGIT